jgi:hypothetical protein
VPYNQPGELAPCAQKFNVSRPGSLDSMPGFLRRAT